MRIRGHLSRLLPVRLPESKLCHTGGSLQILLHSSEGKGVGQCRREAGTDVAPSETCALGRIVPRKVKPLFLEKRWRMRIAGKRRAYNNS